MSNSAIIPQNASSALAAPIRDTLTEVLDDPTLNRTFGGKDNKLSPAQSGLAAAVTVKMQQRLMEQMQTSHQRELSLVGGFIRLYRLPLFQTQSTEDSPPKNQPPKPSRLSELFSWGNLIAGAAVILVAVSFYYTKLTANYEQQWKNAEAEAKSLTEKLDLSYDANRTLEVELAETRTKSSELDKALKLATATSTDIAQALNQRIEELAAEKGQLQGQASASKGQQSFKDLYTESREQNKILRDENAKLLKRAQKAEELLKQPK